METLKETEYCLWLVHRKHWFVYIPDSLTEPHIKIDVGQYEVDEICCCTEEDVEKEIKNLSWLLEDGNNAMLTCDRAYAYYQASLLNKKVNEDVVEQYHELVRDDCFNKIGYDFDKYICDRCYDIIENRKRGRV